jgi:hypothetical protein
MRNEQLTAHLDKQLRKVSITTRREDKNFISSVFYGGA